LLCPKDIDQGQIDMKTLKWDESLLVGLQKLDEHNRKLFNSLCNILDALEKSSNTTEIRFDFADIYEYMTYHFACEEIWMEHSKYEPLPDHLEQHKTIKKMFFELYNTPTLKHGSATIMLASLIQLLIQHIQTVDVDYGLFERDKTLVQRLLFHVSD
jgi:hemerythrin-like metal-binding protein